MTREDSPGSGDAVFSDPDLLSGRLFYAVAVPAASRASLEVVLPELGRVLPGARLTGSAGWHLTLAFLGQVRPERSADVVRVGEQATAGVPPLRLRLAGAGAFPSERRARVLWAGVEGDVGALVGLAGALAAASKAAGLRYEEREYTPHLTLARFPVPGPVPDAVLALVRAATGSSPAWQAASLHCYRSTLTNRGARYRVVRSFPLRG